MESQIKSSFIPRDTAQYGGGGFARHKSGASDLFLLFSIVTLVASVALGVGVFLYEKLLSSTLTGKKQTLVRAQESFEPTLIAEMNRLDDRMSTGEDLLEKHLAPSVLFHTFEELTLDTVSLRTLAYEMTEGGEINLKLSGLARSVNSIALQADLFGKHGAIISPIFSNINRTDDGVKFDMVSTANPGSMRYAGLIRQAIEQAPELPPAEGELPEEIPGFAP
ncbi:MAG: hypothetical protein AAB421_00795 [Patescibacteria group bacterium]